MKKTKTKELTVIDVLRAFNACENPGQAAIERYGRNTPVSEAWNKITADDRDWLWGQVTTGVPTINDWTSFAELKPYLLKAYAKAEREGKNREVKNRRMRLKVKKVLTQIQAWIKKDLPFVNYDDAYYRLSHDFFGFVKKEQRELKARGW